MTLSRGRRNLDSLDTNQWCDAPVHQGACSAPCRRWKSHLLRLQNQDRRL